MEILKFGNLNDTKEELRFHEEISRWLGGPICIKSNQFYHYLKDPLQLEDTKL